VTRLLLEAPDFERSPLVGAALITLYSRYIRSSQKASLQVPLFVFDQLDAEFEELAKMIRERLSKSDILDVYSLVGSSPLLDGGKVEILSRQDKTKPDFSR
jgi:hypothetical protein